MQSFEYRGKVLQYYSVTGKIAGSSKRSETYTSGGGERGGVVQPIRSTVVRLQDFFVQLDDGREVPYQLRGADIPVRDGHTVSMISGSVDGNTFLPVRLVNYNTGEVWPAESDDSLAVRWKFVRSTVVRFLGTLGVIFGALVPVAFLAGAAGNLSLAQCGLCALPLLIGFLFAVYSDRRAKRVARQLGERFASLGFAMLAGPRPASAASSQATYAPVAAPAPAVQYQQVGPVNPPAPVVQAPYVNPPTPAQVPITAQGAVPRMPQGYCTKCGSPLRGEAGFCGTCGERRE